MKNYAPAEIRNFAIVGHASSGKTLLSEAMLRCAGVISRMGSIADGTTVSDYHVSEKNRQISVSATLMHADWEGKKFNLVDTPGYLDFISEGLGALRSAISRWWSFTRSMASAWAPTACGITPPATASRK